VISSVPSLAFIGLSGDACVPEGRAERPEGERVMARRGDGIDLRGRTARISPVQESGKRSKRDHTRSLDDGL
jgi:hypothetical protein